MNNCLEWRVKSKRSLYHYIIIMYGVCELKYTKEKNLIEKNFFM